MTREYVKQCLKELDRYLKKFPRGEKVSILSNYHRGVAYSLLNNYPQNSFNFNEQELGIYLTEYKSFFEKGKYVGCQFGDLELDLAKELLSEVEKRKVKFSKPGFFEGLAKVLSEPSQPHYLPRVLWQQLRDMGKEE